MSRKQALSVRDSTAFGATKAKVCIWEGSIRSGKTYSSILAFLIYIADAPTGGELVIIGKNRDSIYRNVFKPIEEADGLNLFASQVNYRNGATTATILGRLVHVIGANDAKAESKIRGMTVAGAYVDEVTVLPKEFFMQLLGRMSVPGAQLFGTTNPDSPAHWLKTDYLDKLDAGKLPHWRRFHFTMDDNPSLEASFIAERKAEYTGLWYKRFILGLWVSAEGAIFDMWDPDRHVVKWQNLPKMQRLIGVGMDYGTTNATTGLLLGLSKEKQGGRPASRLYLVDEFRYDSRQTGMRLSDVQLSHRFRDWLDKPHLPYTTALTPDYVFLDPSAASFKQQLWTDDLDTRPAVNDVSYGIRLMASLLSEDHLAVSDRCSGIISEFPGYSWDSKKSDQGLDVPVKVADHSLDGGRYVLTSTEMQWQDEITWTSRFALAA
jgi:PBSX family phage terminase large subunit